MTDVKNLTPPANVEASPFIKKIPTIQLATDPNAIASNFIPTSLLASTGTVMPLSLISNPYLTGMANNEPTFSQMLSMGLVSSAKAVSEAWITVSGQSVTFNYPSLLVFNNDFFQMPPCTLSVSSTDVVSVLYVAKSKSGMSPLESQIGLIQTQKGITAQEALSYADSQIIDVYMPLAVLNGDESGNQTLMWELDKNSQFAAPVLNQFVLLQDFEANAKQFLTSQFTALYNDLVQFATWQRAWDEIYFACNFSQTNIGNVVTPGNVAGEGITGVNYSINQIVVEPIRRRYSCNLVGLAWLQNCNVQSAYPGWNETYGAPLIYTQERGGMEAQLNGLIPNFESYTSTYYYAPSQDIGIPNALYTDNGNDGPSGGGPGYNKWQKTVIWSSTDGNLYTHTGAPNQEYDGSNPVTWPLPHGVEIQLRDANTNETVLTWPQNPLFNPSFAQAYPVSTSN